MAFKRIAILFCVVLVASFTAWWAKYIKLDYSKIVFVLPSSNRAASPYFYKKDGDFFLADDLRSGFEKKGYQVEYRFREDYEDLGLNNAGNIIYFKGYYNFKHLPGVNRGDGRKRVLYLYYVEGLHPEILKEVDAVACASKKFIEAEIKPMGVKTAFVPQFTNPERFKKPRFDKAKAFDVLFVGSNHSRKGRKSVDYAVNAQVNLAVFGKFWEEYLEPHYLKGTYIDNDGLYEYYGNAKVVLNDHREDMKHFGFVSNRIYDVTASGGFVLTDYLPEIEEIYGDAVATYKNFDEFNEKLSFYLMHAEERENMAKRAQNITLREFTNDKAAEKFLDILKNI